MSSEQEEERREYVERDEPVQNVSQPATPVTVVPAGTTVRETEVRQPVIAPAAPPVVATTTPPGSERRESVVKKTNTNTGAIVAMIVGAIVLLLGIYLVFTRVFPYLSYPWSLLAVLLVAIIFMIVGTSLLQTRTRV